MQLFSAKAIVFSKKKFWPRKKEKKHPQKLLIIGPQLFFYVLASPAAQMAHKQKSRTTKSPLIQDWVFRLGFQGNANFLFHSRKIFNFNSSSILHVQYTLFLSDIFITFLLNTLHKY